MRGEGDVEAARADYYNRTSLNLRWLLRGRYVWMNRYLQSGWTGVDVGCGTGLSAEFIQCKRLFLTDFPFNKHLDLAGVDALNLPFRSASLDFLIVANVVHHLPYPLRFFCEASRVLHPGGVLLLVEPHASLLLRFIPRLMRHEGYSFDVDPFDEDCLCTRADDPWAGNNAMSRLLFENWLRFSQAQPGWERLHDGKGECLSFLNSGGVTAKTFYLPLPAPFLKVIDWIDAALIATAPDVFALGRQVALRKI